MSFAFKPIISKASLSVILRSNPVASNVALRYRICDAGASSLVTEFGWELSSLRELSVAIICGVNFLYLDTARIAALVVRAAAVTPTPMIMGTTMALSELSPSGNMRTLRVTAQIGTNNLLGAMPKCHTGHEGGQTNVGQRAPREEPRSLTGQK